MNKLCELREEESTCLDKIYGIKDDEYNPDEDLLQLLPNVAAGTVAGTTGLIMACSLPVDIAVAGVAITSACLGFFAPQAMRKIKLCYYQNKLKDNREEQKKIILSKR